MRDATSYGLYGLLAPPSFRLRPSPLKSRPVLCPPDMTVTSILKKIKGLIRLFKMISAVRGYSKEPRRARGRAMVLMGGRLGP